MSTFKVEVVRIRDLQPHPNADRLDIANLEGMGYQVIVAKGTFCPGDLAFYFPIDSVIPETYLDQFGIRAYYSKKLRAAKLRGMFSEGLLIPVEETLTGEVGADFTAHFGVTKYEYPLPQHMNGEAEMPIGRYKFPAPEHLKRYRDLLVTGETVIVTEKLHGTNFTVLVDEMGMHVGSHNYFWKLNEVNRGLVYVRAYREWEALQQLPSGVQIFGEVYGVQDIKYGLTQGKLGLALFAVRQGGRFLDYDDFLKFCAAFGLPTVPLLYRGPYSWEAVTQFNNADSTLDSKSIMEGVIVQPLQERTHPEIGRIALKLLSDRYLLRKEGTELH